MIANLINVLLSFSKFTLNEGSVWQQVPMPQLFLKKSAFSTFWSSSMKLSTVGTEIKFQKTRRLTHVSNLWSSNLSAHSILNCFLTNYLYYPCLIISNSPTSPLSILRQRVFGITFPTNLSSCKISFYGQKETKINAIFIQCQWVS